MQAEPVRLGRVTPTGYLGVYSRGLPTRITLGYHYVRLQYLFNAYCSNLCVSVLLLTLPTNWHCALAGLPVPLQDTALRPQAHLYDC